MTNRISAAALCASFSLHGLIALPLLGFAGAAVHSIYDEGSGSDAFRRDQGITVDLVSVGDVPERIEIAEVAPMIANPTPPPFVETKPLEPEVKEAITATESPSETLKSVEEQPTPPEPPKPQEVAVRDQTAQIAMLAEKSAGQAEDGGKATALSAYVGKIYGALQRAKTSVSSKGGIGQVTLGFTLDANGKVVDHEVIQSSGVASLDKAAIDWLERAEFPPLPGLLAGGQRFNVPLTFKQKSS